jgi:methyltransferase-like protein/trans-aconitate methyltransferase
VAAASEFAYDQIPYLYRPIPETHPDRMATLATLFGMNPPDPSRCRLLELGCGDGANLLPMASTLPQGLFVGCDLAKTAIDKALADSSALGLRNTIFLQADLSDLPADLGEFDYIVAHGLYSWVPERVRRNILSICESRLAPQGVAYISYNVYPGAHLRDMLRGMLLYHTAGAADMPETTRLATGFLEMVASVGTPARILKEEVDRLRSRPASSLFHDEMSDVSVPLYFHEFVEQAAEHGLQYLSETDFSSTQARSFPEAARDALETVAAGDAIRKEQYMDFLRCRRFRQTLLCRRDVALATPFPEERLSRCYIAAQLSPSAGDREPGQDAAATQFSGRSEYRVTTDHPFYREALLLLADLWPLPAPFGDLLDRTRRSLGETREDDAATLARLVAELYATGAAHLSLSPPPFTVQVSEKPVAFPLARFQARNQTWVSNLRHGPVRIEDEVARRMLTLLDGTRDHDAIARELDVPLEGVREGLARLARTALLVEP